MKEILKYLRQLNSLTQDEVAKKLGLSRQWYLKMECGKTIPTKKTVKKISEFYQVSEDFIYQNKVPSIKEIQNKDKTSVVYKQKRDFGQLAVADSGVAVAIAEPIVTTKMQTQNTITIQGYFDGKAIQIDTPEDIQQSFFQGQRFQLIPLYDEEAEKRRQASWEKLKKIIENRPILDMPQNDDPYYKEMLYDALAEKYLKNNSSEKGDNKN